MTSTQTVYLVSGANRGVGLGLVRALTSNPANSVFAGSRDPSRATELGALAKAHQNIHLLKLTSADDADNRAAVRLIREKAGRLDVVIANAAISKGAAKMGDVNIPEMLECFTVNSLGPLVLFQAAHRLLLESMNPKWILISGRGGSMGDPSPAEPALNGSGTSKAAANYIVTRIHAEYPTITSLAINPGLVQTSLGNEIANMIGMDKAPATVEESAEAVMKIVEVATREQSGKFWDDDGKLIPW